MNQTCSVEIRETDGRPRLVATLITEGTAARGGRAEVFEPHSITWPETGVDVLLEHRGAPETRAIPVREDGGQIRISVPATPAIVDAVRGGRDKASIEFHPVRETRTAGGVRAVQLAVVSAFALVRNPEYPATGAEIRTRGLRWWL